MDQSDSRLVAGANVDQSIGPKVSARTVLGTWLISSPQDEGCIGRGSGSIPTPRYPTVMEEAFADPEKLQGEPAGPALCPILTG